MLNRLKKALQGPPVTAEWADMVIIDMAKKADQIEAEQGTDAANRYREKSGLRVRRMLDRGIIPSE